MAYRCEQAPVVIVERRPFVLAAEHPELVAQHDDFNVVGPAGSHSEAGQRREQAVQNAVHTLRIGADSHCSTATSEYWAPTGADPAFVQSVNEAVTGLDATTPGVNISVWWAR